MATPAPLPNDDAKRLIETILDQGTVVFTHHCRTESMQQRSVSAQDVLHVLETGQILRAPEWDDAFQNWKYRVEGVDLDGDDLAAITVIIVLDFTVRVLTVF
jgi:hypothetical protein